MNDRDNERLVRHVQVDTSERRVDRLWEGIEPRLGRARPSRRWIYGLAAVGAAVALLVVFRPTPDGVGSSWEGASLETGTDATSVTLVDGSKLTVEPSSRVEVGDRSASSVKLHLRRGRIGCDVTHRPGRSFVVTADGVEVRVVGTRFSVSTAHEHDSARVSVRVERGVVEVRGAGPSGQVARVEAGHSWSQVTKLDALADSQAAPEPARPVETPVPAMEDAPPVEMPSVRESPPAARPSAGPSHSRSDGAKAARSGGARELFEAARERWREGDVQAAADAYQRLLAEHPTDPRAGLAAFELGRLRMDRLGDMRGAEQALERAVALAPGSGFREDAMARLVSASAAAHDVSACVRARDQYLAEFPSGVHRRTVALGCGAR